MGEDSLGFSGMSIISPQTCGGWFVVNHSVDCRDDIGVCGHPLWLNGVDGRDNVGGYC